MSTDTEPTERPWQDEQTLRRLYVEGDSTREDLAARWGISQSCLDDWLARYGITKRWSEPHQDRETLAELYLDEGLTLYEIADHFDVSYSVIQYWVAEHDLTKPSNDYTDGDMVRWLRSTHNRVAWRVRQDDIRERPAAPSVSAINRRFGSWREALNAAGIDPDAPSKRTVLSSYRETLDCGQGTLLRANPDIAAALYRTDDPWFSCEVELDHGSLMRLKHAGIVTHDGSWHENPEGRIARRWTTTDGVRAWIDDHVGHLGSCPRPDCDAAGISNLGDGRYTCSDDGCDSRFGRETAEEVLGR